ncbi:hypothetical protein EAC14_13145 [Enterococcus faecium]|uniref:Relaxasome subunit MobC n=1 Tax=Pisciglobus halotolerans TaxID=745365 RepID=A0A1I3DAI2_9LACT|nr:MULTISPECIES: hypothetical protein [Lactobacillales]EGP5302062.1 hypothetical protein [Enterococcus faecium]MBM6613982.1 hypothetical protein [Desemzia sp. RIT 804]MBM6614065.1 hypothetical protein [Desemzia sp. RIT 804]MBM6614148.1 hypothetical protein [Desemzia sp. RIT 804]PJK24538.1 hypothetical protein CV769_15005 [Enterococcus mundtii]
MSNLDIKKKEQEIRRLQRQMQRDSERLRKERTHRLIQKGALLEAYFDMRDSSIEETEKVLNIIAPEVKKIREQNF